MRLLIDTGSTENLLNKDQCPNIFIKPLKKSVSIKTAAGTILVTDNAVIPKGSLRIPLRYDTTFRLYSFHKFFDGILGHRTLRENKAIIDYDRAILYLNGEPFKLHFEGQTEDKAIKNDELSEIYHVEILGTTEEQLRVDHLNSEEAKAIRILIQNNEDIFYHKGDDLTFTNEVKHEIPTGELGPVYTKTYRYPAIHTEEVERQIGEMLDQKIIQHSSSPYNAPIWIVPKKEDKLGNKEWRIVIDYRKLNMVTKEDKYPIPRIDDILDKLGRANYFSTLDLTKGFYQIELHPDNREKTAFSTHNGHYEFLRMPFGLKNAPATFQRMMNNVLRAHVNKICVIYMDDILVFSTSLQEHVENLGKVFETLRKANLKVSLNKSDFMKKETDFLGHVVTRDGIKPNPKRVEGIQKQIIPKTVKEIQSFLGLSGYYRKFIPDYAKIAKPMTLRLKKDSKIDIGNKDYKESFEKLRTILMSNTVLQYPNFEEEFHLTTDASNYALGAVLSQSKGPIAFVSRTLNKHEINYSTIEKELLAIVWATGQFRHYVYGRKFKLFTDHKPLVWLANIKEPNSKLIRWKIKLNEYEFDIEHVEGKENKVADALSRTKEINILEKRKFKCEICEKTYIRKEHLKRHLETHLDETHICPKCPRTFKTTYAVKQHLARYKHVELDIPSGNPNPDLGDTDATIHSADEDGIDHIQISENPLQHYNNQIWIRRSDENNVIETENFGKSRTTYSYSVITPHIITQILCEAMTKGHVAIYCENISDLLKIQEAYKEYRGNPNNIINFKIILTTKTREEKEYEELLEIIAKHHRFENNHPGIEKTYAELKEMYYYPNLKKEITKFINNCVTCNFKIERNPIKLPFEKTETPLGPHEHYHMDIWFLNRNIKYLTMIDKFSKYAMIEEISDSTSLQIIRALTKIFIIMKKPKKITLDNESSFKTSVMNDFFEKKNIETHFTTPHRHTGNSDIERFHGTLNEHIRILKSREENNDVAYNIDLPYQALEAYNNSLHSTTRKRPIDIHFRSPEDLEEIYRKIEERKEKTLEYRNKDRKDEQINTEFRKDPSAQKLDPKHKKIKVIQIDNKKFKSKNTMLHKDQFIKRKNLSRSLEVLYDATNDNIPGTSSETCCN